MQWKKSKFLKYFLNNILQYSFEKRRFNIFTGKKKIIKMKISKLVTKNSKKKLTIFSKTD